MEKNLILWACIFGMLAVGLGAFGAHGLKAIIDEHLLAIFHTGVRYQFYHCFAIFVAAWLYDKYSNKLFLKAGYCFVVGIFLFSGSLYLLACRFALGIEHWSFLGPLTPLGGFLFMIGWGILTWGVWNMNNRSS